MSSDDDFCNYGADNQRRRSLATPVPPSAGGGLGPDSPILPPDTGNINDDLDQRVSLNGNVQTTASEIAISDERVRHVLYSDVVPPSRDTLMLFLIPCRSD